MVDGKTEAEIKDEIDNIEPNKGQRNLKTIEFILDAIYLVEIILNFFKRNRAHTTMTLIAKSYLRFYFYFDVISIIPLFAGEGFDLYWLKCFRFIHLDRLYIPLELFLGIVLSKYSKKRQSDLIRFLTLILLVIYVAHFMACIWIYFGGLHKCDGLDEEIHCTKSWIHANDFTQKNSQFSVYIFAFYWIFEVITTVGYGDYTGATSQEYIFSIILEFLGLTFFSFLMGSINGIFSASDNFEDLIEEKLDSLDMWIKKIEKSNKPFHIQPTLYNDIRRYVEQAFYFDFNLVIEEFSFYQ